MTVKRDKKAPLVVREGKERPFYGGGAPLKYPKPELLKKAIDAYFESCFRVVDGEKVRVRPYTITALARMCNLSRRDLLRYRDKDGYGEVYWEAISKIREFVEERLLEGGKSVAGAIFWLKNNAEWVDRIDYSKRQGKDEDKGLLHLFTKSPSADSGQGQAGGTG